MVEVDFLAISLPLTPRTECWPTGIAEAKNVRTRSVNFIMLSKEKKQHTRNARKGSFSWLMASGEPVGRCRREAGSTGRRAERKKERKKGRSFLLKNCLSKSTCHGRIDRARAVAQETGPRKTVDVDRRWQTSVHRSIKPSIAPGLLEELILALLFTFFN